MVYSIVASDIHHGSCSNHEGFLRWAGRCLVQLEAFGDPEGYDLGLGQFLIELTGAHIYIYTI